MNDFNITVFEKRKMLNQFYQKCQQAESAETAHWLKDSEDSNPVYLDMFNLKKRWSGLPNASAQNIGIANTTSF